MTDDEQVAAALEAMRLAQAELELSEVRVVKSTQALAVAQSKVQDAALNEQESKVNLVKARVHFSAVQRDYIELLHTVNTKARMLGSGAL